MIKSRPPSLLCSSSASLQYPLPVNLYVQTDRQTDKQTDRPTDRQTDRPTDRVQIYIDFPDASKRTRPSHALTAFYIAYPDDERARTLGLVSTIADDPPMLNWIYVDERTLELKYGNRTRSREHHVGPWDWTKVEGDGEGDAGVEGGGCLGGGRGAWWSRWGRGSGRSGLTGRMMG